MHPTLVDLLCDPVDRTPLRLENAALDAEGGIRSGLLISQSGRSYPIVDGIARFHGGGATAQNVASFGEEWNYFNYDDFKLNWLRHVVGNTFGTTDVFRDKVIVDCGAGSGMQTKWMAECGARRVIALELSQSVDGVMRRNLAGLRNVDVIQCSIDQPPLRRDCVPDIVICHNVIQHTRSVEDTARALWSCVGAGGEFVFNCYMKNTSSFAWMLRWRLVYRPLRALLSRCSFRGILAYAKTMACLRFVPLLGWFLERAQFMVRGDVPQGPRRLERLYKAAVLNTYDWYGYHEYQHQKTADELQQLVAELQPDPTCVVNAERFFSAPQPVGIALRVRKA
jgi:SAM-dependent methyltransferase/uncharacterized protein YbaR (Trm112 family)